MEQSHTYLLGCCQGVARTGGTTRTQPPPRPSSQIFNPFLQVLLDWNCGRVDSVPIGLGTHIYCGLESRIKEWAECGSACHTCFLKCVNGARHKGDTTEIFQSLITLTTNQH